MNEKFFSLAKEKQEAILNAGYRVFSQNTYKNSPVSEIAAEAGISKSLLFYYFRNKKELYMYLWDHCSKTTIQYLEEYGCYECTELFDAMERGMKAKIALIRQYPDVGLFAIKAYMEKDPEIRASIQKSYRNQLENRTAGMFTRLDPTQFAPGIDIKMMYKDMYLASVGYLFEMFQKGKPDFDALEREFNQMIAFWKQIYLRKE